MSESELVPVPMVASAATEGVPESELVPETSTSMPALEGPGEGREATVGAGRCRGDDHLFLSANSS